MFNYISGTVAHIFGNTVVVDVHGIGYEILATTRTTNDLTVGQNAKLFTYLQVREDGVSLFGFATMEEKTTPLLMPSTMAIQNYSQKSRALAKRQPSVLFWNYAKR